MGSMGRFWRPGIFGYKCSLFWYRLEQPIANLTTRRPILEQYDYAYAHGQSLDVVYTPFLHDGGRLGHPSPYFTSSLAIASTSI